MHAELVAIFNGLHLAWELGFKKVICETDSLMTHDLLLTGYHPWHTYATILNRITTLIDRY